LNARLRRIKDSLYRRLHPKRFRIFIALSAGLFVLGLAGGYYTALAMEKKIGLLLPAAVIFAILSWLGSGADFLGFFRDWYKDVQEERGQRKQKIAEHSNKLVSEFEEKLNKDNQILGFTWKSFFDSFEYSKEFRQHLFSGHNELYDLLYQVIESEQSTQVSFMPIFDQVKQRLRDKLRQFQSTVYVMHKDDEDFDVTPVAKHIVEETDPNTKENFKYKEGNGRIAVSGSGEFVIPFDLELTSKSSRR
jgi:hypothetical protein